MRSQIKVPNLLTAPAQVRLILFKVLITPRLASEMGRARWRSGIAEKTRECSVLDGDHGELSKPPAQPE